MKLKGKYDSDPNLNFLDELEEDKWLKHIGESMESGSSLLLTQRNVYISSTPTSTTSSSRCIDDLTRLHDEV